MEKKAVNEKKLNCFTSENIWIWLDKSFEIFISDASIKEGKIHTKKTIHWLVFTLTSNKLTRAKTVDKNKIIIKSQLPL